MAEINPLPELHDMGQVVPLTLKEDARHIIRNTSVIIPSITIAIKNTKEIKFLNN